jgi:transcriptional regulator with XRE-family HTH domain
MDAQKWYKHLVNKIKDTLEYRFESVILDITEDICRIMKEKNISRSKLAEKLNISRPAVTRMLGGNPNFTLKRLLAVADALDLELVAGFKERKDNIHFVSNANTGFVLKNIENLYGVATPEAYDWTIPSSPNVKSPDEAGATA